VALPAKTSKLVAKDLPKSIKASGILKKNYRVKIDGLNLGIEQLRKTAIAKNSTARSIYDVAKEALKRGIKSLDKATKKVGNLESELSKMKTKLTDVSEKLHQAHWAEEIILLCGGIMVTAAAAATAKEGVAVRVVAAAVVARAAASAAVGGIVGVVTGVAAAAGAGGGGRRSRHSRSRSGS
jgi:hypothetical protein